MAEFTKNNTAASMGKQMMTQRTASENQLSVVRECSKCYNIADGQIL